MLTQAEFKEKMGSILNNAGDAGAISEILTDVLGNYNEVTVQIEMLTERAKKLEENNASLVKANGELFMKVGAPTEKAKEEPDQETTPTLEEVLENVLDERGKFK